MLKNLKIPALATGIFITFSPAIQGQESVTSVWGKMEDGREVGLFTLTNKAGTCVRIAEYGALLVSAEVKDREGKLGNVTLSYSSLEEALAGGVFGSVIGRFANRIDDGGFTIDGERHELETYNRKTLVHIHGGKTGFHRQLWSGRTDVTEEGAKVVLQLSSPDGHEGFPGKVDVEVTYTLTDANVLRIEYRGTTDQPTHLNLTNHAYFNLSGEGDIRDHDLQMNCNERLEIDDRKIPTGKLLPVSESPFDFQQARSLGSEIDAIEGGGYDHCFVIPEGEGARLVPFATLTDSSSGRTMEIATTKPGAQIYTANHFKGTPFPRWGGICFETQYFPDSPNQPEFPSSLLRPGETYEHVTEFRFGVMVE